MSLRLSPSASGPVQAPSRLLTRTLLLLAIGACIENVVDSGIYAGGPLIARDFYLSDLQISLIPVSEATGVVLVAFPLAVLADRYLSRKWMLVCSVLGWAAFTALSGAAASFLLFLIVRCCMGFTLAPYDAVAQAMVADSYPQEKRPTALGIQTFGWVLGVVLGIVGDGLLTAFLSWHMLFVSVSILPLLLSLFMVPLLRDSQRGSFQSRAGLRLKATWSGTWSILWQEGRAIIRSPAMRVSMLGRIAQQFALAGLGFFFPLFLERYYHLSNATAFLLFGVLFVGNGVGSALGGSVDVWLMRRVGPASHLVVAGIGTIGMGGSLALGIGLGGVGLGGSRWSCPVAV